MYRLSFLLFMLLRISSLDAAQSASNLCYKTSLSCSSQAVHSTLTDDDCRMVYYKRNGKECSSIVVDKQSYSTDLGTVLLQSFMYTEPAISQTGFNVSFMNISWTSMTIRFMQNRYPDKNTCREFHVSEQFLGIKSVSLFYDCLWSYAEYEEKIYNFEYMAKNSLTSVYHKYVFVVPRGDRINPNETDLTNWEVFIYIDITNSPAVLLKFQTIPKQYNVTKYMVKAHSGTKENSVVKDKKIITVMEDEVEVLYEWNIGILPGNYFFTVQPLSAACGKSGCLISRSPDIIDSTCNPIYVGIGLAAVILLALICVYLKLKMKIFTRKDSELSERPTLLLIYRSTHSSHIKVVVELAKYMREHYKINALVDELDVNKSESQNPFHWYNDAVADADFIAIVSSPTCCDSISGIYPKADEAALCLLHGKLTKRQNFSKPYNLMVFLLPYGSKKHLPGIAKNIGLRFKVPNQLNEVSYYIHNYRERHFFETLYLSFKSKSNFVWNLVKDRKPLNKKCPWPKIRAAIQEAGEEIRRCAAKGGRREMEEVKCQDIDTILSCMIKENIHLEVEEPLKMNCNSSDCLPLDDAKPYAEYPGLLDEFNLLGSKDEVVIQNSSSKGILPLDGLEL